MGFYKSPKSPSYCITDIPIQAAGQKKPQIGIMKFLLISESPASLPPTQKNSTYPSQAGAIELHLIWNYLFLMNQTSQVFTCS